LFLHGRGRGARLYERYGGVRQAEAFVDTGIRAVRSIAVDYSGASGAPCLIAITSPPTGEQKEGAARRNLAPPSVTCGRESRADSRASASGV